MSVIQIIPTFSHSDLDETYRAFGRALSSDLASHWERSRPEDGMADILSLLDADGLAVLTVVRTREGYSSYDKQGQTIASGRTVGDALTHSGRHPLTTPFPLTCKPA